MTRLDADLLVAGGGPVGLMTAVLGARAGLRVVVAEPRTGPVDKACGEGLMPGAVAALRAIGVEPAGRPFRGIRYLDSRTSADACFPDGAHGLGVRRTTLHDALRAAVSEHGVETREVRVDELRQHHDHVEAAGLRARHVVAADGLRSPVRSMLGLTATPRGPVRYGVRQHYAVEPWTDLVEVHWTPDAELYVTPVRDDLVGVAVLGSRGHVDVGSAVRGAPRLAARLGGAEPVGRARGAGPLHRSSKARVAGRVLLAGDASGYVDALTGEGIAVGFAQAAAAVRAVVDDDLPSYERRWREATAAYRTLTGALLHAQARPAARRLVVPTAARAPWLMRWAVHRLGGSPGDVTSFA